MKSRLRAVFVSLALLLSTAAGLSLVGGSAWGRPGDAPTTQILALTDQIFDAFGKKDYQRAETLLRQALELDPTNPVTLYNLACALSLQNQPQPALGFLIQSVDAGFLDFAKIERDTDLDALRHLPGYIDLMDRRESILRTSAEKRIEMLKEEFGDGYIYEINEEDRLIFATNTDPQTLAVLKEQLVEQAHSQWRQIFDNKPQQYICIVLPSPEDFRRIVPQPYMRGLYKPFDHLLITSRLGQTMVHEFTHALHGADLDALEIDQPIWLMEGMATLWESARFENGEMVPADSTRLELVQHAARRRALIPLARLVRLNQHDFVDHGGVAYGQAGSLLLYVHEKGLLREFYELAKSTAESDPTCRKALEKTLGKPIAQIDRDWRRWMMQRTPPPRTTGEDGAFLGIAFNEQQDGLLIDGLVPGAAAEEAGIKRGDVLVGLEEQDVRDYPSLISLLSEYEPGDTIILSVRRDGTYLDVEVPLGRRPDVPQTRPATRP